MVEQNNQRLWHMRTGFAVTHCRYCAAGWTRTGESGGALTVCLLDREPVLAGMTSCDRFTPTEAKAKTA